MGAEVPEDVRQAFKNLSLKRRFRWIIVAYDQDKDCFVLEHAEGDKSKKLRDLADELPVHEPRYVVYDHEYVTADQRPTDKLYFIMWSPAACAPTVNMAYHHARPDFRGICNGCYDLGVKTGDELVEKVMSDTDPNKGAHQEDDDDDWMDM